LEKQVGNVAAGTESIAEILLQTWREEPNIELGSLNIGLITETSLDIEKREGYYPFLLKELLRLFDGERAFAFAIEPSRGNAPEVLGCVSSVDLDNDPVSSPERKVSPKLLVGTASSRKPLFRALSDSSDGDSRESSLLAIPAISRLCCQAVLVVENRFQQLSISATSLRSAFLYSRLLAWQIDIGQLVQENDSLWQDLNRLRDSTSSDSRPAGRSAPRATPSKNEKRKGLTGDYSIIVGSSSKMLEILQVIDRISSSTAPVLINGESGTGKELVALAVHANSPRATKTFVSENCAAITETLLESELFGYIKGAFTGANKDHKGLFEHADTGTLFLDEVGDMSASMQKKLLRVLQEGVIRRVGSKDYTSVDVRIVSATNKDLLTECRRGNFREDLYYRLNVINLKLPALRERREDVAEMVQYFLAELVKESGTVKEIDTTAMQKLVQYSWPGNVRELQNAVKKLFALSEGTVITADDLSDSLTAKETNESPFRDWQLDLSHMTLRQAIEELETEMIRNALSETGGNKSLVAKTLQIPKTSLYNKINKYKLS